MFADSHCLAISPASRTILADAYEGNRVVFIVAIYDEPTSYSTKYITSKAVIESRLTNEKK